MVTSLNVTNETTPFIPFGSKRQDATKTRVCSEQLLMLVGSSEKLIYYVMYFNRLSLKALVSSIQNIILSKTLTCVYLQLQFFELFQFSLKY